MWGGGALCGRDYIDAGWIEGRGRHEKSINTVVVFGQVDGHSLSMVLGIAQRMA